MNRKSFLALLLAAPAAALAAFRRKPATVATANLPPGYFRSRYMLSVDPAQDKDNTFVFVWKRTG